MTAEEKKCAVKETLGYLKNFFETKMCTKCHPCLMGTAEAIGILERITEGEGKLEDLKTLELIANEIKETARCKFGKDAAQILAESLSTSGEEYVEHIEEKSCKKKACLSLITYKIIAETCVSCDVCKEICPEGAILGDKYIHYISDNRPYVILRKRCTKCEKCVSVCEVKAIEIG